MNELHIGVDQRATGHITCTFSPGIGSWFVYS